MNHSDETVCGLFSFISSCSNIKVMKTFFKVTVIKKVYFKIFHISAVTLFLGPRSFIGKCTVSVNVTPITIYIRMCSVIEVTAMVKHTARMLYVIALSQCEHGIPEGFLASRRTEPLLYW